jgi:hypothetical protein
MEDRFESSSDGGRVEHRGRKSVARKMAAASQLVSQREERLAWLYTPEFRASVVGALSSGSRDCDSRLRAVRLRAPIESSGKGGSMARKRFQRGSVYLCGRKPMWYGSYREDIVGENGERRRIRRNVLLGSKKEYPTQRLAERELDRLLLRINDPGYRPSRVATVAEFVERWKKQVLSQRKPSTKKAAESHLGAYILPRLGKLRLDDLGVENQQMFVGHLSGRFLAKPCSTSWERFHRW